MSWHGSWWGWWGRWECGGGWCDGSGCTRRFEIIVRVHAVHAETERVAVVVVVWFGLAVRQ